MRTTHCIEVATFALNPGVEDSALVALEARMRAVISREAGYLGRELARDEATGEWLLLMRFETRAQMDAWMAKVKSVPEMREMGALLNRESMKMRFFTSIDPTVQSSDRGGE